MSIRYIKCIDLRRFILFVSVFLILAAFHDIKAQTTIDFNSEPFIESADYGSNVYVSGNIRLTLSNTNFFEDTDSGLGGSNALQLFGSGAATETLTIETIDGAEIDLQSFFLSNFFGHGGSIQGFRDGSSTGTQTTGFPTFGSPGTVVTLSSTFDMVDRAVITFSVGANLFDVIDAITYTVVVSNTPPTASSFAVTANENLTFTFATSDFNYNDSDGDLLQRVRVITIPSDGTLYVDADNDDTYDIGEQLPSGSNVFKADLDAGNLQYIQNGATNTSFTFDVNDGTDFSTSTYTATISVTAIPTVTLSVSPTSQSESSGTTVTVTATLSNAYGANTTVNLAFSGTAIGSGVDYSVSSSSITVNAGATTGTMNILNVNDALYEGNETVIVDILSVTNGTESGIQQQTYTIIEDDPLPTASLILRTIYNPITDESGGQAYIVASIDAVAGTTVTVPLSFSGTATGGGTDYSLTGSTIIISAGEIMDSIRVTSQFDGIEEGSETVIIDMGTPTNATENGTQQVTLTIQDEDATFPSVTIATTASSPTNTSPIPVTFTFSENVTGFTSGDVTVSNGTISGFVGSGASYSANITPSGDGVVTVNVAAGVATDGFGNANTAATQLSLSYDGTAPSPPSTPDLAASSDTGSSSTDNITSDDFPTFTGTAEAGATVTVISSVQGNLGTTIADGTGAWSAIFSLFNTTHNITATARDAAGNTSSASPALVITIDRSAPLAPSTPDLAASSDTGSSSTDNLTSDNTPTFTGTAEANATITLISSIDGTLGTTTADGSGDWTFTSGAITTNTSHNITATATDVAGNISALSAALTITLDGTVPSGYSVAIDQSPIGATNDNAISFTFAGAEVGTTYNYTFTSSGGAGSVTGSGTIATSTDQVTGIDLSGLADGTITLSVTLVDEFGNVGTAATDTEIKDTTAPAGYTVVIDQSAINLANQSSVSFTFASAEVGASYNYTFTSDGGAGSVTGSGTIATTTDQVTGIDLSGLADGTITLSVILSDIYGNDGAAATDSKVKDTSAPSGYTVAIDLLGEVQINVINETIIEFNATGLEIGTTLNYSFTSDGGGAAVTGTGTVTSTSQTFNNSGAGYNLSGLTDGLVTLTITLTDGAGNTGVAATDTETKDAGAPTGYTVAWDDVLINASEAANTSFTISSAEIGATLNYSISSTGDGNTATVTGSNNITSATQATNVDVSALTDGTLTVSVTLTDGAGNTGGVATDNTFLDSSPPSGYTVSIDQTSINQTNTNAVSFTFSSAEIGATYDYTFTSSAGGTPVTGTGTVTSATQQISGIDISSLPDGDISLNVSLTDPAGNIGEVATDAVVKDAVAPVFISVDDNGGDNSYTTGESLTIIADLGETGLTVEVDLSTINAGLSSTASMTDNGDGTYSITIADVDVGGNLNEGTVNVAVTATDASGNSATDNSLSLLLDKTPPAGYTVSIDQAGINTTNQNAVSFTFAGAETGASYSYTFSSNSNAETVTGSGTIASPTDQVTGIDLSALGDGTITLEVVLSDAIGNSGATATDNVSKVAAEIQFAAASSSNAESVTSTNIEVQISVVSAVDVDVSYTLSGTATGGGVDYTQADGTLTIPAGSTSANITLANIIDDTIVEENETIVVTLSSPVNAVAGAQLEHTYTIIDNDALMPQTITFDPIPDQVLGSGPVILNATGGASGLPITFTITTQPTTGVATLSNGTIIIEGVGQVSVTASQAGNNMYEAAPDVTRTFNIISAQVFLPTLFTPNGDGTNDSFVLRGGGEIAEIELSIYDREGNRVYNTTSIAEITQTGWDGTHEGNKQPQGAYVWVIKGKLTNGVALLVNGKDSGIIKLAR